jgi:nondiscriminating glutamyl-tRNA synthetase
LKEDIIPVFSIDRISKSPSKFDIDKLDWLNEQHLRMMDADTLYNTAMEYLSPDDFKALDDELGKGLFKRTMFELADGYSNLKEIPQKFAVFRKGPFKEGLENNIDLLMQDKDRNIKLLKAFRDEVSAGEMADSDTAFNLMRSAGGKAGCKGKDLYHPLRVALTGGTEGFELKRLLPLFGKERILKRIDYVLEILK